MLRKSEGIIVKSVKFGETSNILDIFSPDNGLSSYMISGIRSKSQKKQSSVVSIPNLVDFVYYDKPSDSLKRIKEVKYAYVYSSLPFNIIKSSIALFLTEVCRKSVRGDDQYKEVYHFIKSKFIHLDMQENKLADFHIFFLLDLASYLGFGINNNYSNHKNYFSLKEGAFLGQNDHHSSTLNAEDTHILYQYLIKSKNRKVTNKQRSTLLNKLIYFYQYHVDSFGHLRSLNVLLDLFS